MNRDRTAEALKKVGSRFKLCVLLQKRVIELVHGAPRLVDCDARNHIDAALEEILADKITLIEDDTIPEAIDDLSALEAIDIMESEETGSVRL
jgi:DNA-directed RNA polymerase subunit K/omega